jgi:hypothetical protein
LKDDQDEATEKGRHTLFRGAAYLGWENFREKEVFE